MRPAPVVVADDFDVTFCEKWAVTNGLIGRVRIGTNKAVYENYLCDLTECKFINLQSTLPEELKM